MFCCSREEPLTATEPLIDVNENGRYTGCQLNDLIRTVQEKLDSNVPAEEFKVCSSKLAFGFSCRN